MPSGKRPKGRVPEYARGKQAVAVPVTTKVDRLSWRLAGIDLGGPWSWRKTTAVELAMLHAKIRDFETMTADEVFGPNRGNKHIPVGNLAAQARDRLENLGLDDLDDLYELRLGGRTRLWGFRQSNVIHVLWWDPDHTVCPAPLRHT